MNVYFIDQSLAKFDHIVNCISGDFTKNGMFVLQFLSWAQRKEKL